MKQICFMESLVFYINPLPPPYTSCYITWNYSDNDFIFFSSILLYVHVSTPMHVMLRENNRESWTKWFNPFSSTFTSSINPHLSCLCTWCMLKENKMEPWTKPFSSCTCVLIYKLPFMYVKRKIAENIIALILLITEVRISRIWPWLTCDFSMFVYQCRRLSVKQSVSGIRGL